MTRDRLCALVVVPVSIYARTRYYARARPCPCLRVSEPAGACARTVRAPAQNTNRHIYILDYRGYLDDGQDAM